MTAIQCPRCGREAVGGRGVWSTNKPYCSACGWNLERAKEKERSNLKQLPITLLWVAAFTAATGYYFTGSVSRFRSLALFSAAFLAISAFISWRKLRAMQGSRPGEKFGLNAIKIVRPKSPSVDALKSQVIYERLRTLTKPRRVKLKAESVVTCTVFVVVAATALLVGFFSLRTTHLKMGSANSIADMLSFLVFGLIFFGLAGTTIRDTFRDRRLLENGDIALAMITSQRTTGGKRESRYIEYEFKDMAGRANTGKAQDRSRELYEDMQTPVFYNPDNPSENVVLSNATATLIDF